MATTKPRRKTNTHRHANTTTRRRKNTRIVVMGRKNTRRRSNGVTRGRRNPSIAGISGKGMIELVGGGVAGVALGNAIPGFLPATMTSNPLFAAASVAIIGWGAGAAVGKFFNKNIGDGVFFGTLMQAASGLINSFIPGLGLSGFVPAAFNEPDNPVLAGRMRQAALAAAASAAASPMPKGVNGVFSAYGGAY